MKLLKGLFFFLFFAWQSCSNKDSNFEKIINSPENFDGKVIAISGFYYEEFENVAIYLKRNSDPGEAIWVEMEDSHMDLNGKRLKLKGRFDKNNRGHLGISGP